MTFQKEIINLDITNKCTLQCSFCERQKPVFKDYRSRTEELSLEDFKKIAKEIKHINLCGQISDPIFHPDILKMIEFCYKNNNYMEVHTAATAKSKKEDWYIKAFKSNPNVFWSFGIDGLPQQSSNHRINQDSAFLFKIMVICNSMGMDCERQCIVFDYNEKDIDNIKKMAKVIGIKLKLILSNRFDESSNLKPSQGNYIKKKLNTERKGELVPKCFEGKELGHSALGYITPCCWLAEGDAEKDYPELCNQKTKINKNSIYNIIHGKAFQEFENILKYQPEKAYDKCWQKCSTLSGDHKKYIRSNG